MEGLPALRCNVGRKAKNFYLQNTTGILYERMLYVRLYERTYTLYERICTLYERMLYYYMNVCIIKFGLMGYF